MGKSLDILKKHLDKNDIKNDIEILSNGKCILHVEGKGEFIRYEICVEEPIIGGRQVRLYTPLTRVDKGTKQNVCKIINSYNQKYNYLKFIYQESEQGNYVIAAYSIPALDSGLTYYFDTIFEKFVYILDDIGSLTPMMIFNEEIISSSHENND